MKSQGLPSRKYLACGRQETLERLEQNAPYDGLFFDIHGAMSVVGLDDPEGDFIARIREVIGTGVLISTSMDLHGNVSWRLAEQTDLITCYRLAPHEDALESKERAAENLLSRIESGLGKPAFKAWIPVPILLPGENASTRIEPGKSLYSQVAPAAAPDDTRHRAVIPRSVSDEGTPLEISNLWPNSPQQIAHSHGRSFATLRMTAFGRLCHSAGQRPARVVAMLRRT